MSKSIYRVTLVNKHGSVMNQNYNNLDEAWTNYRWYNSFDSIAEEFNYERFTYYDQDTLEVYLTVYDEIVDFKTFQFNKLK